MNSYIMLFGLFLIQFLRMEIKVPLILSELLVISLFFPCVILGKIKFSVQMWHCPFKNSPPNSLQTSLATLLGGFSDE